MKCTNIKSDNSRCNAQAIKGEESCFMHSPANKQERFLAQQSGGLARKHRQSYISEEMIIESPKDIQKLIEVTINSILLGRMPSSSPATQLAYLSNTWLSAYEKGGMVERIEKMEAIVQKAQNEN
jgi:hypothetical protein